MNLAHLLRNSILLPVVIAGAICSLALLHPTPSYADDDPCAACGKEPKDPTDWKRSLALGFNLTEGNSNTLLLNLTGKLNRDYKGNIWRFELDGNYGENDDSVNSQGDNTTQENFKLLTEYDRLLTERLYIGIANEFFVDNIAGIDYRDSLSLPIGYFLIREDDMRFSVEAGPGYVFEKLEGKKNDYFAPKVGERFEWSFSETAKVFQAASYTFNFDDSDDYIVNAEIGIEAALNSMLSLVTTVKDDYDNVPTSGRERNDVSVISALQFNL